jgi:hypothetical protein
VEIDEKRGRGGKRMSDLAILSVFLFIGIIILSCYLYRENKEKKYYEKEWSKEHCIRRAFEYAYDFPTLESEDFNEMEKLMEQAEKGVKTLNGRLTRMYEAIISFYKSKQAIYKEIGREQKEGD